MFVHSVSDFRLQNAETAMKGKLGIVWHGKVNYVQSRKSVYWDRCSKCFFCCMEFFFGTCMSTLRRRKRKPKTHTRPQTKTQKENYKANLATPLLDCWVFLPWQSCESHTPFSWPEREFNFGTISKESSTATVAIRAFRSIGRCFVHVTKLWYIYSTWYCEPVHMLWWWFEREKRMILYGGSKILLFVQINCGMAGIMAFFLGLIHKKEDEEGC